MTHKVAIDRIIRSKRRTVALEITPDAKLIVRAGLRTPVSFIEQFAEKKRRWIDRKIREAAARPKAPARAFAAGETFPFLGNEYPLTIVDGADTALSLSGSFLLSRGLLPRVREVFIAWYRREAERVIGERLQVYARASGIRPAGCRISGAEKRWGSCAARDRLSFSWRLVMAPLGVVDYVVAHELAHVEHKDHSRSFWKKVAELCPRYAENERWLKENGHLLVL